jgi:hypothetical protein
MCARHGAPRRQPQRISFTAAEVRNRRRDLAVRRADRLGQLASAGSRPSTCVTRLELALSRARNSLLARAGHVADGCVSASA